MPPVPTKSYTLAQWKRLLERLSDKYTTGPQLVGDTVGQSLDNPQSWAVRELMQSQAEGRGNPPASLMEMVQQQLRNQMGTRINMVQQKLPGMPPDLPQPRAIPTGFHTQPPPLPGTLTQPMTPPMGPPMMGPPKPPGFPNREIAQEYMPSLDVGVQTQPVTPPVRPPFPPKGVPGGFDTRIGDLMRRLGLRRPDPEEEYLHRPPPIEHPLSEYPKMGPEKITFKSPKTGKMLTAEAGSYYYPKRPVITKEFAEGLPPHKQIKEELKAASDRATVKGFLKKAKTVEPEKVVQVRDLEETALFRAMEPAEKAKYREKLRKADPWSTDAEAGLKVLPVDEAYKLIKSDPDRYKEAGKTGVVKRTYKTPEGEVVTKDMHFVLTPLQRERKMLKKALEWERDNTLVEEEHLRKTKDKIVENATDKAMRVWSDYIAKSFKEGGNREMQAVMGPAAAAAWPSAEAYWKHRLSKTRPVIRYKQDGKTPRFATPREFFIHVFTKYMDAKNNKKLMKIFQNTYHHEHRFLSRMDEVLGDKIGE